MRRSGKLLALMLAVLLLASVLPLSALAVFGLPFTDVPRSAWYYPVVKTAYDRGITNGTTSTTFEPDATVTREQFLVMLYRAAGIELDAYHEAISIGGRRTEILAASFSDVDADAWYAETVCLAKEMEVTSGVGDGSFGVGEPVTREQMATFAARFMDVRKHVALKNAKNPVKSFADADQISDWAKDAVEAMRVSGVMQGDAQQRLHPQDHATRAEAAAVVLRLTDATERVSFVPEGTAWIRLQNQRATVDGEQRQLDIKNPTAVKEMIRHLDNVPIAREYGLPQTGGWICWISFYDAKDQYLGGFRFDSQFIDVNSSRLITATPYFRLWTLRN